MKVDCVITAGLADAGKAGLEAEQMGFQAAWTVETKHDPFLPLALAAEHTADLEIGTSVAIAFARNPMITANLGYDLQEFSKGRLILGLGSQISTHIEKRFSMPWSRPAPRMREFILALRAIWAAWQEGTRLDFDGEFYSHRLMTPEFNPGPNPYGSPKVFLGAVGPRMTEVAGEVADGLFLHSFTTEAYLREVTIPALDRGRARAAEARLDFEIACPVLMVTGATEERMATAIREVRRRIAFYASTPAYRPPLEAYGAGDLHVELNALSKQGRWNEMGALIDDDLLNAFAVIAEPSEVGPRIEARFGGVIDRMIVFPPYNLDVTELGVVLESFNRKGLSHAGSRCP
jgi:probable F420-dependent oxidoreductase